MSTAEAIPGTVDAVGFTEPGTTPCGNSIGRFAGRPGIAVAGRTNKDPATAAVAVTAVSKRSLRMHHSITQFTLVTYASCVTTSTFHPTFIFRATFQPVPRAGQKAKSKFNAR